MKRERERERERQNARGRGENVKREKYDDMTPGNSMEMADIKHSDAHMDTAAKKQVDAPMTESSVHRQI